METVQLTCGHCGQVMAIAAADLGAEVHCPHCQQLVQAPAPESPPSAAPSEPVFCNPSAQEVESIFSSPEETEDPLFGDSAAPRVELPSELATEKITESGREEGEGGSEEAFPLPPSPLPPADTAAPPVEAPALPIKRRRQSQLGFLLLVFLVPYSIIITGAFLYMLYAYRNLQATDPLERMPDPDAKNGAKKVSRIPISPDRPLPEKLKTVLGQPLRIGDLEVKPLKVELTAEGDLMVHLEMRNVSQDAIFNPLSHAFTRRAAGRKSFTYLQAGDRTIEGGDLEWSKAGHKEPEPGWDGTLRPGEAMIAKLTTSNDLVTRATVKKVMQTPGPLLWRLHVRRGLVEVHGRPVSATAVIGVRFTARDIGRPPAS
jgi:phage FluMu protein Com